jgi:hypothetical protein
MKIVIEFIPHNEQRYDTVGDYWVDGDGNWQLRVDKMDNEYSQWAVAVHELVEMMLVVTRAIPLWKIDEFDMHFKGEGEPGDDPKSPYFEEHTFSTSIERMVCEALGINWKEHDDNVYAEQWHGEARRGSAWQGGARSGEVRQGEATHG